MPRPEYFKDSKYKDWRKAVLKRDGHKCRMCGATKKLHCHHIKPWATHPDLRYVVGNGVTVCTTCHDKMAGDERAFEKLCLEIRGSLNPLLASVLGRFREPPPRADDDQTKGAE